MQQEFFKNNYLYSLITPPNKEEILLSKDISVEDRWRIVAYIRALTYKELD